MNAPRFGLLLLLGGVLAGCFPDVTGATCDSDANCPDDQFCKAGNCAIGPRGGGSSGGSGAGSIGGTSGSTGSVGSSGSSGSSSSGSSGSSGSDAGPVDAGPGDAGCAVDGRGVGLGCAAGTGPLCLADGGGVLRCDGPAPATVCSPTWRLETDCGARGLSCDPAAATTSVCVCPAATGTDLFVDADARDGDAGFVLPPATGAASPAFCRLPKLADGISRLGPNFNRLVLSGTKLPPPWSAATPYAVGDRVTAPGGNTSPWRCTTAGQSGATAPSFDEQVGNITADGTVNWTLDHDAVAPMRFDDEPVTEPFFPQNTGVISAGCVAGLNAPTCDPRGYIVMADIDRGSTTGAFLAMVGRTRFAGFSIANETDGSGELISVAGAGNVMERMNVAGKITSGGTTRAVDVAVRLRLQSELTVSSSRFGAAVTAIEVGPGTGTGPRLTLANSELGFDLSSTTAITNVTGLHITGGQVTVTDSVIGPNSGTGIAIDHLVGAAPVTLGVTTSRIERNRDGLVMETGSVVLDRTRVQRNTSDGVLMKRGLAALPEASFRATASKFIANDRDGIRLAEAGPGAPTATGQRLRLALVGNELFRNGSANASVGGGLVLGTAAELGEFASNRLLSNSGAQVRITATQTGNPGSTNTLLSPPAADAFGTWNLTCGGTTANCPSDPCNSTNSAISCSSAPTVGLKLAAQADGWVAQGSVTVPPRPTHPPLVRATGISWNSSPPTQNSPADYEEPVSGQTQVTSSCAATTANQCPAP